MAYEPSFVLRCPHSPHTTHDASFFATNIGTDTALRDLWKARGNDILLVAAAGDESLDEGGDEEVVVARGGG